MKHIINIILCITLSILLISCVHKDIYQNKMIIIDKKNITKSCIITNNFYSDQCIEETTINYNNIDYIELSYKYEMDFNFPDTSNVIIKEKTDIIIEQDNETIYTETIDKTKLTDTRDKLSYYRLEGNNKIYIKPIFNRINNYLKNNNLSKANTNSYIKRVISFEVKGKIPETNIVEYVIIKQNNLATIKINELIN